MAEAAAVKAEEATNGPDEPSVGATTEPDGGGGGGEAAAVPGAVPGAEPGAEPGAARGSSGPCVGDDCGNCDAANAGGGARKVLPPPTAWFNRSSWDRVNALAAATNLEIIFGLNSRARAATDTPWDGRYGQAELIDFAAAADPLRYPVAGFELGNEPDLFCRGNSTILPALLAKDFVALRKRLDKYKPVPGNSAGKPAYEPRRFRLLGPDTAGIGDRITNSTTGNPKAIYLHHFTQFATNLSKLDPPSPHASTPGKTHRRTLTEITFHQYYFKGPTADPSGRQFIDVGILDSLRPKIEIALAQVGGTTACLPATLLAGLRFSQGCRRCVPGQDRDGGSNVGRDFQCLRWRRAGPLGFVREHVRLGGQARDGGAARAEAGDAAGALLRGVGGSIGGRPLRTARGQWALPDAGLLGDGAVEAADGLARAYCARR